MHPTLTVLASGSRGNSFALSTGNETILIDAGLSARQLKTRLTTTGHNLEEISALMITHEHTDHMYGVSTIADKWNIPVFGTPGTLSRVQLKNSRLYKSMGNCAKITIGSVSIQSFPVPHDARDPVGFIISTGDVNLGIITDLGNFSHGLAELLRICNWLVLECNHDLHMLQTGSYPRFLKDRIRGNKGHLSNDQASSALRLIASPHLRGLILAHLSEKNNTPELAKTSVMRTLHSMGARIPTVVTALQDEAIGPFDLNGS